MTAQHRDADGVPLLSEVAEPVPMLALDGLTADSTYRTVLKLGCAGEKSAIGDIT